MLTAACLFWSPVWAADGPTVKFPTAGSALQGVVVVTGSSNLEGFQSMEVSFNYDSSNLDTWFLIQRSLSPVREGVLAVWDTTTIADGDYRLRVQIILSDGDSADVIVPNLRVRNYTPAETNTPLPASPSTWPGPGAASTIPTPALHSQPTPLPTNDLTLTPAQLSLSGLQGAGAALVGLVVLGLLGWVRRR